MSEPLKFYDISTDEWRDATQDDLDRLQRVANRYGYLRTRLVLTERGKALVDDAETHWPLAGRMQ